MKNYQRINNLIGFILFAVATGVYWLTMEPSLSFWDCGEFLSAAYKLQVGHQPGAPLFLMIGRMFSVLAMGDTAKVAYWINFSSVLFSAGTIMFLYWTITALALRLYPSRRKLETAGIFAAGIVGALAYTFSDTFWFSAVEAEVYALSSLFTAMVFWAILKWERQQNDRWLIFIAFLIGLSIGAHLLSLLAIPAVVFIYYLNKTPKLSTAGIWKTLGVGGLLVGIVQVLIVQYTVLMAAKMDLFFVNTLKLGFGSGALFSIFIVAVGLGYGLYYSNHKKKYQLNLGLVCLTFLLFGFSSYFTIVIRANAKPNINLSNPDNAYSLYDYLGRTNYGETPLLYGRTFDAEQTGSKDTGKTYRKAAATYEESGQSFKLEYDKNMFFPRMYSNKAQHPEFYRQWTGLQEGTSPDFFQNLHFFSSYQVGFMYFRYFLWNFVGRQNDEQGQGSLHEGNWISGIKPLDAMRLGNQSHLPETLKNNEGRNVYYGLPLLLGIAGLVFLYQRNKGIALVVCTLFFFTGLAIILYLNQDPLQVRERDYAYVGSFYAFAILIGFGFLAVKDLLNRYVPARLSLVAAAISCILAVPVLMGLEGWDDHNRSNKTTALQYATNYLNSCAANAILFTNADNDTFPLWYAQEVEGIRTDVRIVCLQFLGDDSYINQMKKQMNKSAPLPMKMEESKYVKGLRDYLPYVDYDFTDSVELKDLLGVLTSDAKEDQVPMMDGTYRNFLPTKKLKLTVHADQVIKTNTVSREQKDQISNIEWTFNKNFAGKADLAMFDILINNNWERPVYFGSSLSEDTYIGLDKYLYQEGYAYRLLPLARDPKDERIKEELTNNDVMYQNVMDKMDFSAFRRAHYLDPEARRIAFGTWSTNNILARNLLTAGEPTKARNLLLKTIRQMPTRNYTIKDSLNKLETIHLLYELKAPNEAAQLAKSTFSFVDQELAYLTSLTGNQQRRRIRDIQWGMHVLNGLQQLTAVNKQQGLHTLIKDRCRQFEDAFTASLG